MFIRLICPCHRAEKPNWLIDPSTRGCSGALQPAVAGFVSARHADEASLGPGSRVGRPHRSQHAFFACILASVGVETDPVATLLDLLGAGGFERPGSAEIPNDRTSGRRCDRESACTSGGHSCTRISTARLSGSCSPCGTRWNNFTLGPTARSMQSASALVPQVCGCRPRGFGHRGPLGANAPTGGHSVEEARREKDRRHLEATMRLHRQSASVALWVRRAGVAQASQSHVARRPRSTSSLVFGWRRPWWRSSVHALGAKTAGAESLRHLDGSSFARHLDGHSANRKIATARLLWNSHLVSCKCCH